MSIVLNMTVLTSAIYRTLYKGVSANGDTCLGGQSQSLNVLKVFGLIGVILPNAIG